MEVVSIYYLQLGNLQVKFLIEHNIEILQCLLGNISFMWNNDARVLISHMPILQVPRS